MKRQVAKCKSCGTEFSVVGEFNGCPNCGSQEEFKFYPLSEETQAVDDAMKELLLDDGNIDDMSIEQLIDEIDKLSAEINGDVDRWMKESSPLKTMPPVPSREGHCRTCAYWRKLAPQAGSCPYRLNKDLPVADDGLRITMWYDTCQNHNPNKNYKAEQIEIMEKRRAHTSILRAMGKE